VFQTKFWLIFQSHKMASDYIVVIGSMKVGIGERTSAI